MPEGFKLAEDSATQILEGMVIEDRKGNQWVWIPCYVDGGIGAEDAVTTGLNKFDRYDFHVGEAISSCTETVLEEDKSSIAKYGGFFIGRYEAGREDTSSTEVLVQKDKIPYTNETFDNMKKLANGIAELNNYNTEKIKTKMCSGYAWDTTLLFVQKKHAGYATTAKDKNGNITGLYGNSSGEGKKISNTGKTIPVCNIYDMGGNVWDTTTEVHSIGSLVIRGGNSWWDPVTCPPGVRSYYVVSDRSGSIGFRPIIYLK